MKKLIILLGCLYPFFLFGQGKIFNGEVVSDQDNQPLVGVTVLEKGTYNAVITDVNGNFNIKTQGTSPILVFSFVGMITQEHPAKTDMKIRLKEDVLQLEEVMVTAYGTSKKASFTGSASVIDNKKIEKLQVSNISQLLQGAGSGVQVIDSDGQPGSDATIRIRGISSINGVSSPLYVVDGTLYGGYVNAINPNDIETITILKDASATALYGSRAASGVVLITTKKGKTEKPQFNFRSSFGFSQLAVDLPEVLSPRQYHEMAWEAIRNGYLDNGNGVSSYAAASYATENLTNYLRINAYDNNTPVGIDGKLVPGSQYLWKGNSWKDALFKNRLRMEMNADVSGSTKTTDYFISLGYLDDKGSLTVSEFKRYSGRVNVNTKIREWFEVGLNTSLAHSLYNSPDQSRVIRFVREVPDIYPIYEWDKEKQTYRTDENGNRILDFGSYRPTTAWPNTNPLGEAQYDQRYSELDNVTARLQAGINLPYNIQFKTTLGVDYSIGSGYDYYNNLYGWSAQTEGKSSRSRNRFFVYTFNTLLTWDKQFNQHHINILAGHEAYSSRSNFLSGEKERFPMGGIYELNAAATLLNASSSEDNLRLESWLSKIEYDFMNKYYLSGSFRTDGSSRFSKDQRWGNFWSVGASWRISNEEFLKNVSWINNLKLKASYGSQGNDNIGSLYGYQGTYTSGWNDYDHPGYLVGSLPTPNLRWESNYQINIGLDARLWNRIDFSFEWYDRTTKNLLFWRDLPPSTGVGSIKDNIGDVRNRGIELQINSVNILTKDFRWETDFNLSHYRNKILKLPMEEKVNGLHKWKVGKSVYDFFMPEWAGVDPDTGDGYFWQDVYDRDANNQYITNANGEKVVAGKVKVTNYSDATRHYQKSALPKVFGGFTNNFYYRNFDLSVFLYYSIGGQVYDSDYASIMHTGSNIGYNWSKDLLNRWTPDNRHTNVPRATTYSNNWNSTSTRFLYDASYVRVKNITFGYRLPAKLMERFNLKSLRIYFKGDNLFTWSKHKGMDPETDISGVASNRLTTMRKISFGLDLTF